jgi:hypothetical protein
MSAFRFAVWAAAAVVWGICLYAFLRGSYRHGGGWEDNALAWYFLAKGIFCSVSLVLAGRMVELLARLTDQPAARPRIDRGRWEGQRLSATEEDTRLTEGGAPWALPPKPEPE